MGVHANQQATPPSGACRRTAGTRAKRKSSTALIAAQKRLWAETIGSQTGKINMYKNCNCARQPWDCARCSKENFRWRHACRNCHEPPWPPLPGRDPSRPPLSDGRLAVVAHGPFDRGARYECRCGFEAAFQLIATGPHGTVATCCCLCGKL